MPAPVTTAAVSKATEKLARSTQTANEENSAPGEHSATDVWTRTWDSMSHNKGMGDEAAVAVLPATPLATFIARNALTPGLTVATKTTLGRAGGGALGLAVAAYQAVDTFHGLTAGLGKEWQSSNVGEGGRQQLSVVWDQLKSLFHAGDGQAPHGVIGHFGALMGVVTGVEQLLSVLVSAIPSPALPAVRVMDVDVGLPHFHAHPPNVPGPGPIPSTGPVIPIPYVSGAATVLINGMPAARCGDMGLGVWCGGYFPLYEIFLGSSSVWLEGARAARAPTDVTKHCIFSNPKSIVKGNDLPIGPPIGIPVGASPNVIIGGIPMPSLTAMAMAAGFKGLAKAVTKVPGFSRVAKAAAAAGKKGKQLLGDIRHLGDIKMMRKPGQGTVDLLKDYVKARRIVGDLLDSGKIEILDATLTKPGGDKAFREWAERDLRMMASTPAGREVLNDIALSPHKVVIEPVSGLHVSPRDALKGPMCVTDGIHVNAFQPGVGTSSRVRLDPNFPYNQQTPSHRVLTHEMGHAANNRMGTNSHFDPQPTGFDPSRWSEMEEFNNIHNVDNPHADAWGYSGGKATTICRGCAATTSHSAARRRSGGNPSRLPSGRRPIRNGPRLPETTGCGRHRPVSRCHSPCREERATASPTGESGTATPASASTRCREEWATAVAPTGPSAHPRIDRIGERNSRHRPLRSGHRSARHRPDRPTRIRLRRPAVMKLDADWTIGDTELSVAYRLTNRHPCPALAYAVPRTAHRLQPHPDTAYVLLSGDDTELTLLLGTCEPPAGISVPLRVQQLAARIPVGQDANRRGTAASTGAGVGCLPLPRRSGPN